MTRPLLFWSAKSSMYRRLRKTLVHLLQNVLLNLLITDTRIKLRVESEETETFSVLSLNSGRSKGPVKFRDWYSTVNTHFLNFCETLKTHFKTKRGFPGEYQKKLFTFQHIQNLDKLHHAIQRRRSWGSSCGRQNTGWREKFTSGKIARWRWVQYWDAYTFV